MIDNKFQDIPAVARRLAHDELVARIVSLESELAEAQTRSQRLAQSAGLARDEFEAALALQIAANESLRAQLDERSAVAQSREAVVAALEARLATAVSEHDAAAVAVQAANELLRTAQEAWKGRAKSLELMRDEQEISTCRKIADRCLFIVGFARSNTTITLEMLNCADNALLLGEAGFFLQNHGPRFSDWYNDQHKRFLNQITKSSYAPDFIPNGPHEWWQWLDHASKFYDCIGEKIALSHYHLEESPPDNFRAFHEARFLSSRYIFMLRNPVDALLSSAKLMGISTDGDMTVLCIAWLDYLQLWSDSIRVFPRTITLVVERFSEETVSDLEAFTGLDLGDARLLISPANRRVHKLTGEFTTVGCFRAELEAIYADAIEAVDENRALWQAEQKRTPTANDTAGNADRMVAMTSRPLGRLWLKIQTLRETLSTRVKEDTREV